MVKALLFLLLLAGNWAPAGIAAGQEGAKPWETLNKKNAAGGMPGRVSGQGREVNKTSAASSGARDAPKTIGKKTKLSRQEIEALCEKCERLRGPVRSRIYYGTSAPDEHSTVGIRFTDSEGNRSLCTGVIIDRNSVLTAGHCSCGSRYTIEFGEKLKDSNLPPIGVKEMHSFAGYDCNRPFAAQPGLDYALMKFNPADLGVENPQEEYEITTIMAPRTAQRSVLWPNASLKVVGYGETETGAIGERRKAEIPILSWYCSERWAESRDCQSFSELILSELGTIGLGLDKKNKDSCGGDSGGPAFAVVAADQSTTITLKSYLVAITSRGMNLRQQEIDNTKRCGGGGVYEVVARHSVLDWLTGLGVDYTVKRSIPSGPYAQQVNN